jgi:ATP-dependent DNA helicase RecG
MRPLRRRRHEPSRAGRSHRAGRLDNARLRAISGLDTLGASALLRRLRDRGLLALHAAGPNRYYELGPKAQLPVDVEGLESGTHGLSAEDTHGLRSGTQGFEPDAQGLDQVTQGSVPDVTSLTAALLVGLRLELTKLGTKSVATRLCKELLDRCALRWWTPRELVAVLGLKDAANPSRKHLWPQVTEGRVERRYPENPAHAQQAYRAVGAGAAP